MNQHSEIIYFVILIESILKYKFDNSKHNHFKNIKCFINLKCVLSICVSNNTPNKNYLLN